MEKGDVIFEYVDSKNKLVDIFTKSLHVEPFHKILKELGFLDPFCFE